MLMQQSNVHPLLFNAPHLWVLSSIECHKMDLEWPITFVVYFSLFSFSFVLSTPYAGWCCSKTISKIRNRVANSGNYRWCSKRGLPCDSPPSIFIPRGGRRVGACTPGHVEQTTKERLKIVYAIWWSIKIPFEGIHKFPYFNRGNKLRESAALFASKSEWKNLWKTLIDGSTCNK